MNISIVPAVVAGYDMDDSMRTLFTVTEEDEGVYKVQLCEESHDKDSWESLSRAVHDAIKMFEVEK